MTRTGCALLLALCVPLGCGRNDLLVASMDGPSSCTDVNTLAGCPCRPGEQVACYTGPSGTEGVAPCKSGLQTCILHGDGKSTFGPCEGEILPTARDTCTPGLAAPVCKPFAATRWAPISAVGAPALRSLTSRHLIWTGSEVLVWGGRRENVALGDGGRYDPTTDSWKPMSMVGAPSPRTEYQAVWTGHEMIVWGGQDGAGRSLTDGGRYDPITDSWSPILDAGAFGPTGRWRGLADWTGAEMVLWGGMGSVGGGSAVRDGWFYSPATGVWRPFAALGPAGVLSTGAWTGTTATLLDTGSDTRYAYSDSSGAWTALPSSPLSPRASVQAAWTGKSIFIFGGKALDSSAVFGDGALFDPGSGSWSTIAPGPPKRGGMAVSTGCGDVLVLAGLNEEGISQTVLRYNVATNTWSSLPPEPEVGTARAGAAVVWTGEQLVAWGGGTLSSFAFRLVP